MECIYGKLKWYIIDEDENIQLIEREGIAGIVNRKKNGKFDDCFTIYSKGEIATCNGIKSFVNENNEWEEV